MNNLLCEIADGVALVTINRPKVLNALTIETLEELAGCMKRLEADDEVAVIILTGAGEKAFVAGADIALMKGLNPMEGRKFAQLGQGVFNTIENLEKPVIAAVNGYALGGGCELAMACDFRIASEQARFGQPEVGLGIIAGFGGTQRLPRLVGKGMATQILLSGEMLGAQEALRIGLVNEVVHGEGLLDRAKAIAKAIAAKGPVAVKLTKAAISQGVEMDLLRGQELEAQLFALCFATADQKEGMGAFLEKRPAEFQGK